MDKRLTTTFTVTVQCVQGFYYTIQAEARVCSQPLAGKLLYIDEACWAQSDRHSLTAMLLLTLLLLCLAGRSAVWLAGRHRHHAHTATRPAQEGVRCHQAVPQGSTAVSHIGAVSGAHYTDCTGHCMMMRVDIVPPPLLRLYTVLLGLLTLLHQHIVCCQQFWVVLARQRCCSTFGFCV